MLHRKIHQCMKHCEQDLLVIIIFEHMYLCNENMHATYIYISLYLSKYNRISMQIVLFDPVFIIDVS